MNNDEKIRLLIQAKDEASAEIKKIEKELENLGKSNTKMKTSSEEAKVVLANMKLYDNLGAPAKAASTDVMGLISQFGNLATSGNIVVGILGAVGLGFLATAANAIESAARMSLSTQMQETAFKNLAGQANLSGTQIIKAIKESSDFTISNDKAVAIASKAMTSGLDLDMKNIGSMMAFAKDRAAAFGMETSDAFNVITTAVAFQSPRMLRQIGVVINANDAYDTYAKTLGKTKDALSEDERQQAFLNAVMAKAAQDSGNLAGKAGELNTVIQQSDTAFADAADSINGLFVPAVVAAKAATKSFADQVPAAVTALEQLMVLNYTANVYALAYAATLKDTGNATTAAAVAMEKARAAFKAGADDFGLLEQKANAANNAMKGDTGPSDKFIGQMIAALDASENFEAQQLSLAKRHGEAINKIGQDIVDSGKKATKSRLEAEQDAADQSEKIWSREQDSIADSWKSYNDKLVELDKSRVDRLSDIKRSEEQLARDSAQEIVDIEKDRIKRITELDESTGKRLRANITENERANILEEALLAKQSINQETNEKISASERNKRQKEEELAFNKQKILDENNYQREEALKTYNDAVERTRRETQQAIEENNKQLAKKLASIEETRVADLASIEARRVAENKSYAESVQASKDAATKQIAKILEVESESERYATAMKKFAGTGWDPWIQKASEYGKELDKIIAKPMNTGIPWTYGQGNESVRGYDNGGIVPGPIGRPQLAVVHGGEEVRTPAQQQSANITRGNMTVQIISNDANKIWAELRPKLESYFEIGAQI